MLYMRKIDKKEQPHEGTSKKHFVQQLLYLFILIHGFFEVLQQPGPSSMLARHILS